MEAILEVDNIEVVYNKAVQVLRGLSLRVPRGAIVALLGSNGAGKSTTLKSISGLLSLEDGEVTAGEIRFKGESMLTQPPERRVRSGLFHVMEGRHVFEDLNVEENLIAATYALHGRKQNSGNGFELVYEYFPRLKERRRQLAGYLSGGEQQMVAIGRALMARPKLLLADEPSLGLAPKVTEALFAALAEINRMGVAILIVEQQVPKALALAHRAYILEQGRVVREGHPPDLLRDPEVKRAYLGHE